MSIEREDFAFNSHIIIEFSGSIDTQKLNENIHQLIKTDSMLQLKPDFSLGKFYKINLKDLEKEDFIQIIKTNDFDNFRNKSFLNDLLSFRVGFCPEAKKMIFSFHHSLFDGHAQFIFLERLFKTYHQTPLPPQSIYPFSFKRYFLSINFSFIFYFFRDFIRSKLKKKKIKNIAKLYDYEPTNRHVDYKLMEIDKKIIDKKARSLGLSGAAFFSLAVSKAIHLYLIEKGDKSSSIMQYIPKSLRFELKQTQNYQNVVGFIWMNIPRDVFFRNDSDKLFKEFYKKRSHPFEIKKVLLYWGIAVKLLSFQKLKMLSLKKEKVIHDCTFLISSGRTPSEIPFPKEWDIQKLYAVGAMTRSPAIGLLTTSYADKDFLTLEYLKTAFKNESIERIQKLILDQLYT